MNNIVTVDFRNDTLFAVERDDGVFVAVKPISDALGLKWSGQHDRLKRDTILAEGIRVIRMPSVGGVQETVCLRLDLINGWLFTIDHERVRDAETREKVLSYKRECHSVLFRHFYGKHSAPAGVLDDPKEEDASAVRKVTECRQTFGARAAGQLWFKLGLPVVPAMVVDPMQPELFHYSAIRTVDDQPRPDAA